MRAASLPVLARSKTLLISSESVWNEVQQRSCLSHTAVPHNAAFPVRSVSTNATLADSLENVLGCREKCIAQRVKKRSAKNWAHLHKTLVLEGGALTGKHSRWRKRNGWCGRRSGTSQKLKLLGELRHLCHQSLKLLWLCR